MSDIEIISQKIRKQSSLVKWVLGIGAALIVGPFAWFLAWSLFGIASAAIAGTIALAAVMCVTTFIPILTFRLENWRMAAVMAEANRNPIPTLLNAYQQEVDELHLMSNDVLAYEKGILNLEAKVSALTKDLSPEDVENFKADIVEMRTDLTMQIAAVEEMNEVLSAQLVQIKRAQAIWDLGVTMSEVNARSRARAQQEALSRIKKDTALDAVTSKLNECKAELRSRIRSRKNSTGGSTELYVVPYTNPKEVSYAKR